MLLNVTFREVDGNVRNIAIGIARGCIYGVNESFVRRKVKLGISGTNLLVQSRIHLDGILLNDSLGGRIVALRGYALNLGKQFAVQAAQTFVIVDLQIMLTLTLHNSYLAVGGVVIYPTGYQLAVAHVCFLDVFARLDTYELCHQAVHHLLVVAGFVGLVVRQQTQFNEFGVSKVVESEQVGTRLFDG